MLVSKAANEAASEAGWPKLLPTWQTAWAMPVYARFIV